MLRWFQEHAKLTALLDDILAAPRAALSAVRARKPERQELAPACSAAEMRLRVRAVPRACVGGEGARVGRGMWGAVSSWQLALHHGIGHRILTSDTAMLSDVASCSLADQRERLKPHASTHSSFAHSHDGGGLRNRGPGSRGSRESREGGEARTTVDGPQAVTPPAPSLIISPDPLRGSDGERGSSSASGSGSRVPAGQVLVSARLGTVAPAAPPAAARASAEQGDGA
eukprot:1246396-Rhodomonas_salina.3